jgi:hypothetical protein
MIGNRRKKIMSRHLTWFFLAVVMLAASAPLQALNYEVGGCKTGSSWVNFTTISAAVAGVPAGATIQVCPGVYPEQVTITQPLTLKGIASGNANRAVITINPNGAVVPNVTIGGQPYYAQVLVQNVSPAGPVNITGITVDGAGANAGCSTLTLAGILYASSTTGTVNEVTARDQVNNDGCGWGILLYNGSSTNETITVENSSFHAQGAAGGGIWANAAPSSTLTATVSGNFLSNAGGNAILASTNGGISGNVVTSSTQPGACAICAFGPQVVSGNTLADDAEGLGIEGTTAVESNKLSSVATAILNFNVATPIKSNTIKNSVCAIDFYAGASSSGPISGNIINDSQYGFAEWSGPTITGNSLYNIDTIQTTSSPCP